MRNTPDMVRTLATRYAAQLWRCRPHSPPSLSLARAVHAHMLVSGFPTLGHILNRLIYLYLKSSNLAYAHHLLDEIPQPDVVARTTLISAYSAAGNLGKAREVFEGTPLGMRDTVCYNAMITGYSRNGDGYGAVGLFCDMRRCGFVADDFSFASVLGALGRIVEEERHCQQMHCAVVKSGNGFFTSVLNALVSVYVRCALSPLVSSISSLSAARKVFDEMPSGVRDDLSWTTMIVGYVRNGYLDAAREFLDGMPENLGFAWNTMMSGYVQHGSFREALELFRRMHLVGIRKDEFTYTSIVSACANAGLFCHGKQVYAHIIKTETEPTATFALAVDNVMISLYSKCGKVDEARNIFNKMPARDLITWNSILSGYVNVGRIDEAMSFFRQMAEKDNLTWNVMISGLAQNGSGEEALKLFKLMRLEGFEPCDYSFSGVITSCAVIGALKHGCQLHAQVVQAGFDSSLSTGNALITMYSRCGLVEASHRVFLAMPSLDSISWNAMIAAMGQHGHGIQAIKLFELMLKENVLPDRITLLTVISACSHTGLVKEGWHYFNSMYNSYGITPDEDHYARVVDLLCRAGKFSEAKDVIEAIPFDPGSAIWEAVLAGCRTHGNMDLGIEAAERLFELMPQHDGSYVLLSNMYATAGRWDDMAKVRRLMRDRGVKKEPGCSWIEVSNRVHVFLVDDAAHPEVQAVYNHLEQLELEMRKLGYAPDTKLLLRNTECDGQQDIVLPIHSEKLAVVFGLMRLPPEATIRVFKNLRICRDCHSALKFMSEVARREIVVRDVKRFHHFRDGKCSCNDYW